jgi:cytochrome c biogenesis protein CcmG, thiol:disulfide interchange protein DsbE
MSGRRRLFLPLVIVAVAGAAGALVLWPSGRSEVLSAKGNSPTLVPVAKRKPLPNVSGAALTPPPLRIALRTNGRPSFIDVWASWCVPCKEEAPWLAALHRRYHRQIRFLGINVEDSRPAARSFERRYRITYPSIFDRKASLAIALGFFGLPTAYLVDRRGRVAAVLVGKQSEPGLRAKLARIAAGPR